MFVRYSLAIVLCGYFGLSDHLHAGEIEQKCKHLQSTRPARMVTKTFYIGDLLIAQNPNKDIADPDAVQAVRKQKSASGLETEGDAVAGQLIRGITRTHAPSSWTAQGGPGTIEFLPLTGSLVVRQSLEVQEQIGEFLASQRRLTSRQIALDLTCIEMTPVVLERFDEDLANALGNAASIPRARALNAEQATRLLEYLDGDRRCQVVQTGRLTVGDGQQVSFAGLDRPHDGWGRTLSGIWLDGKKLMVDACSSSVPTIRRGQSFQFRAATTPNGNATWLDYDVTHGWLAQVENGSTNPLREKKRVTGKCQIEKSQTLVLGLGNVARATFYEENRNPDLLEIPVIGPLFSLRQKYEEQRILLVFVTPRILSGAE